MRRKPLPPPPDDLTAIRTAQAAVPLVASSEEDCCARLQGRLELPARDTAATWLDFLHGLGLAEEGPSGFSRVRVEPGDAELAETFLDQVYAAREVCEELAHADEPVDAATVAERTAELVSPWERQRDGPDWPAVWEARTEDLLGWLVLLDVAERSGASYTATGTD